MDFAQHAAGVLVAGGRHVDVQREDGGRVDALLDDAHADEGGGEELWFAGVRNLDFDKAGEEGVKSDPRALFFPTAEGDHDSR